MVPRLISPAGQIGRDRKSAYINRIKPPPFPPVSPGDILVFHGAGAYSRSMASNYGGSLRCPEILLEDGVPRLIRRREVVEDLLPGLL